MGILQFIETVCVQDAVYWEYTGTDEYGGPEFDAPIEVKVRWDEETRIITNQYGKTLSVKATVLTPRDFEEQSFLHLGTLDNLPPSPEPQDLENAYEIKSMERHPLFRSKTNDVFIAYLDHGSR